MNDIDKMIADINSEVFYTRKMIGRDSLAKRVMDAMRAVPRDKFVPDNLKPFAFDNGPLSIGHAQTISQPYIVALMTDLLNPDKNDVVLEVGTGSGYQTAVLSCLVKKVYSMEFIEELSEAATARLKSIGYHNIETCTGNGYNGWPEYAPYDGIIVTAAASHIPEALVEQLKPGGRLAIPIGLPGFHQELMVVEKDQKGETQVNSVLDVAFVPLVND
ncbi:MAG: protein-L-isoaspartate(D-aspartate) O-methyltransferase [Gammaproteobacteria bacterium]|nr:protein-L-isoaspartate(D-aspartate) O-methyltransferase [Gammaproteobacteria bacterium]MCF6261299.1 protein-L-isoaspartate(D-aspartate) O-methyltransferase [Gammaproteobacteria bacterium]